MVACRPEMLLLLLLTGGVIMCSSDSGGSAGNGTHQTRDISETEELQINVTGPTGAPAMTNPTMLPPCPSGLQKSNSLGLKYNLSGIMEKVAPAVVLVSSYFKPSHWNWAGEMSPTLGFIVSEDGLIVIDDHRFSENEPVQVRLNNGATFEAEIKDFELPGLTVIKINTTTKLPFLRLGNSADLCLGEMVLVMGMWNVAKIAFIKELDFHHNGRHYIKIKNLSECGTLDGPLVNLDGEVVGTISRQDIDGHIAISSEEIREYLGKVEVINRLKEDTGIWMISLTPKLAKELKKGLWDFPDVTSGAYIMGVFDWPPAKAAGLQKGDVIIGVDGKRVTSASDVYAAIKRGYEFRVLVKRGYTVVTLVIVP
ncbi:serine protease HTRA1A-like isoform X1 [Dunckerocampus dactyliophorus]|uniref:serine protease HTRA1A-like isoform X1 n=1 Tax=Dunckerocampus dactyliophorus TaxID=161453 RepID=UPI0024055D26|nr:serine protease HTRA1A-like isoform X1 [Dunckerocampus dactyliophorus]